MNRIACALVAASAAACVPTTPYRYTGMVPAARPIPWDGYPSHAGELHAEVSGSQTVIGENLTPRLHDTALHVATTTLEGSASITPVRGLDLGMRWAYASYDWTEPTALGTMPLPGHPGLFGIGPEVHGAIFIGRPRHFALGMAANVMHYDVPYAAYRLVGGDTYVLDHDGSDSDRTMSIGVYPSYSIGPDGRYGTAFALLAAATSFKNDGFSDTPSNDSTIQEDGFVPIVGCGYGIHAPWFHASVLTYVPVGSTIAWGPGVMLTLGVDLPLWHPHRHARWRPPLAEPALEER